MSDDIERWDATFQLIGGGSLTVPAQNLSPDDLYAELNDGGYLRFQSPSGQVSFVRHDGVAAVVMNKTVNGNTSS